MTVAFGTKAETLERLAPLLKAAIVLPQVRFTLADWRRDRRAVAARVTAADWARQPVIVRSSANAEDAAGASQAGRFLSVPNVAGEVALASAVDRVIASYGASAALADQVFVQPMLSQARCAGVAFSRDPNTGAPYVVINYHEGGDTAAVTAGGPADLRTFVCARHADAPIPAALAPVIELVGALEGLLGADALDIEFALDADGRAVLFQVRPLTVTAAATTVDEHRGLLAGIAQRIAASNRAHPYLHGARTIYGVMPDWNPAEIIGIRPRPLALSLYRNLVTDQIWAYQRNNYGYKNLRSFPLLVSFHGLPYVDVRVSFNSFVPNDVDAVLADRLVNYYVDRLRGAPALHDKVEFEIVLSCYALDMRERLGGLAAHGFAQADQDALADSLRRLTNRIVHRETGLWRADAGKIRILEQRQRTVLDADMDPVSRIYWLIEDCKRYGTLPFAGLARAAFVAVQMLRSMVAVGALDEPQFAAFLGGLDTVTGEMGRDLGQLRRAAFLAKYGHLRPGTYDILSPRYDEAPERYFGDTWPPHAAIGAPGVSSVERFALSLDQVRSISRLLVEHGLDMDVVGLFDFLQASIQGREFAKFVFTRSLSDVLSLLARLGAEHGLTPDDMSYADIRVIEELHASSAAAGDLLRRSIDDGRRRYARTREIVLPPLIASPADVWSFHLPAADPNFITLKAAEGPVRDADGPGSGPGDNPGDGLAGAIVFIPSADPGYDWIFARGIAGLVTAYGGVNSHMAIRAGELGLPAVIGAGETLFQSWRAARRLRLDCANRRVEVLG